jgi:hypothetical protein
MLTNSYNGWARSVNLLIQDLLFTSYHDTPDWFVTGGDDYLPDPTHHPDQIAAELTDHFKGTFGVMQPTGDRWGEGECPTCEGTGKRMRNDWSLPKGLGFVSPSVEVLCSDCKGSGRSALIDRICGSPWIGRNFALRMYQGAGALYNGYFHMFADEELKCVAESMGVLWQRPDLTQVHQHWSRTTGLITPYISAQPDWVQNINSPEEWNRSKQIFQFRKARRFPGHEPLPPL